MTIFNIQNRETGDVIDAYTDYEQALRVMQEYIQEDIENGEDEDVAENFYEIAEHCKEEEQGIIDCENERQDV